MRAFVAGASGYTGREVVRELRARGVPAVAHVRPDSPRLAEWEQRFQAHYAVVDTTPWELTALQESLERWQPTHIFALLGTTRSRARAARQQGQDDSYETVDYALTSMLLRAQQMTGRSARFIYLSAIGVNERTRNPYLAVRWRMESELRASGLPYIIARPALVTGGREEFRFGERAAALATHTLLGAASMIGLGVWRDRLGSVTGRELAHALVTAALDDAYDNSILKVADIRRLGQTR